MPDFIDEAKIYVKAGDGGNGCISFRREKYVPNGGPDGGDGGHGGDVIFVANPQLSTLLDFKYQQHYEAKSGKGGGGSQKTGRSGDDLIVEVPVGTLLLEEETRQTIVDLNEPGQRYTLAKGGRGGRGNMNFATPSHQAPRYAEEGTPGGELTVRLVLKLLADVALLGFPNAGKSTLLSVVSAAKPKIADYPFTTLTPNLGVVDMGREAKSFVVADIPGVIEGAHTGRGLGLKFLRHLERSRVLWVVIDATSESPSPLEAYRVLLGELEAYEPQLLACPRLVVLNKTELPINEEACAALEAQCKAQSTPLFRVSAATRAGLKPLLWETRQRLDQMTQT